MPRTDLDEIDPHLEELSEAITPFVEQIDADEEYALLVLGVRHFGEEDSEEGPKVKTFFGALGYMDSIEEGLFGEVMEQVEQGNMALFAALRNVVRDIEEIIGLAPDEQVIIEQETVSEMLH